MAQSQVEHKVGISQRQEGSAGSNFRPVAVMTPRSIAPRSGVRLRNPRLRFASRCDTLRAHCPAWHFGRDLVKANRVEPVGRQNPLLTSPAMETAGLRMVGTSCRCVKTHDACLYGTRCLAPSPSRTAKTVRQRSENRKPSLTCRKLPMDTPARLVSMAKHGGTTVFMVMAAHRLKKRVESEGR